MKTTVSRFMLLCMLMLGFAQTGYTHDPGISFANVQIENGTIRALLMSLTGFNLGVEAGQIAIVVTLIPILYLIRNTTIYYSWIFRGGSTVAAIVALVWMLERATGFEAAGF